MRKDLIDGLIVTPQELIELKNHKDVLLLDLSALETYDKQTIPGAIHLPFEDIVSGELPCPNLLPTEKKFAMALANIGYTTSRHIVAFDDEYGLKAARLYWTLAVAGINDFSYLNGGLLTWQEAGNEVVSPADDASLQGVDTSGDTSVDALDIHFSLDSPHKVTAKQIADSLPNKDLFLWDTRSYAEWSGEDVRAQRGGHIPGAHHLEWTKFLDDKGRIVTKEEAAKILSEFLKNKQAPEQEVVVYCQAHRRSSVAFLIAAYLGIPTRGYDGSWQEWGNDPALPISASASSPESA